MLESIRFAIAEDHPAMRKVLRESLSDIPDFEFCFEASNGSELIGLLEIDEPDVLILDLSMPILSGRTALAIINERFLKVKVIIFSSFYDEVFVHDAFKNGASAYLSKHADFEEIVEAIYAVTDVGVHFNEYCTIESFERLKSQHPVNHISNHHNLTKREKEILRMICSGLTNSEIAQDLFISIRTVENHRKNIFEKTETKGLADLVVFAIKRGLFVISD